MPRQSHRVDEIFKALADPTRRAVIERLSLGPAAVTDLAEPFDMALPSFLQHLRLLEECGLVKSKKIGRVRTVRLQPRQLKIAEGWMAKRLALWEQRFDQLDAMLAQMKEERGD